MKISKMASSAESSLTRQLFSLAQNYTDVVDLTLGDPDIKPSEKIRKAACDAVMQGKTKYSVNAGLKELRKVIANHVEKEYGLNVDPNKEVVVTVGGMEALYIAIACIVDEGDEVIIPAPYYPAYVQMVKMCGGVPVVVSSAEENGFSFSAEDIENAITEKTVAIIINSPCNPTGEVIEDEVLDKLAEIVKKNDLMIITDEVYSSLIYDDKKHSSVITKNDMRKHTVLIDSVSKRFAMTGYRIGYAVASPEFISYMNKMQENIVACAPLPSQYASIAAYTLCDDEKEIKNEFLERRNFIVDKINEIEGLSCRKPAAAFYLFVNIKKSGLSSFEFAKRLLETKQVAVAPGISYGNEYDGYIRIAYTLENYRLQEGVDRIKEFMSEILK